MCQCEALNRGLVSLAVRSLLPLLPPPSLPLQSKSFSPSWDVDKHKVRAPALLWHSRSFEASLSSPSDIFFLPRPFEMRIHVKIHTRWLNLREGRYRALLLSLKLFEGGWRMEIWFPHCFLCVFTLFSAQWLPVSVLRYCYLWYM